MTVWYLATCLDCQPVLAQPFRHEFERNAWAKAHNFGTGHRVSLGTETR